MAVVSATMCTVVMSGWSYVVRGPVGRTGMGSGYVVSCAWNSIGRPPITATDRVVALGGAAAICSVPSGGWRMIILASGVVAIWRGAIGGHGGGISGKGMGAMTRGALDVVRHGVVSRVG